MAYDIVIGRLQKDREKFGLKGAILLGKHYVKMGTTTSLSKIEAFTSTEIDISDRQLPIGRSYKNQVLKVLNISEGSI